MKLGLLVVVAVAVLLPSFSESRIVSKCELRDRLQKMIKKPKKLDERTLATVICEVDRWSHLNTSFVRVFGNRIPTTPKPTVTTAPSTTGVNKMTTAAPTQPTNTNSTTTQLANTTTTTTTTAAATTTTTTTSTTIATSPATTNSTISSMNTTLVSNSTGGGKRRKREAHSKSGEDDSQMEDETSSEENAGHIMKPWSLGLYGLFQLSDKDFCDSGYRQSRNECHTSCTAFTDDDITDDIVCVINTGYLRQIMERASDSCRRASNFFKECN